MTSTGFKQYKVWDVPTRVFHWINFTCIIGLLFFGFIMLFKKELGITGIDAKVGLKEVHIIIGYVFLANFFWRIVWGFIGNQYARWNQVLPGKAFKNSLQQYLHSVKAGKPEQYIAHNPMGRLAILFIFLLMATLAITGLVRAGTDIYYPPFGSLVADYISESGVDPNTIKPYIATGTNEERAASLKAFKKPFGLVHLYGAYVLMFMIVLHIFFVVRAEINEGGLIASMFSGKKLLTEKPADEE